MMRFRHRWRKLEQEKIRVGYVSPYFRNCEEMHLMHGFIDFCDRERFMVYAYMSGPWDEESCRIQNQTQAWRDIGKCTPEEAARIIYEDRIDILLDAAWGEADGHRPILAFRPAPIQMAVLRKPLHGGCPEADYFLLLPDRGISGREEYAAEVEQEFTRAWEDFIARQVPPSSWEAKSLLPTMESLVRLGDMGQALAVADRILAAGPESRAIAEKLCALYAKEEEAENLNAAASLLPDIYPMGKYWKAYGCFLGGNAEEARRLCEEVAAKGGLPFPWGGLEHVLLAALHENRGEIREAAEEHRIASSDANAQSSLSRLVQYSNYLLLLHHIENSSETIYREACRCRDYLREIEMLPPVSVRRRNHGRLRIGYISPDFRAHAVACFSQAFFENADRSRFEIYGYANCRKDAIEREMEGKADVWKNVYGYPPEVVAKIIREDEIDILVELAGHTGGNALPVLAFRPAPIQLCGIGYFSTTGLSCVDGFLVDRHTAPPGEETHFVERLLRLPHSHFCYKHVKEVPPCLPGLPSDAKGVITFGSMNNMNKASDGVLEAWGRIMAAVPDAHLYLKCRVLGSQERRMLEMERLQRVGIDPSRVVMEGHTSEYLQKYYLMDIALDTFPWPGGATTLDALHMGVPVVSLKGGCHHERFGWSILANIGMEGLCGSSVDEYVSVAVELARNRNLLRRLHGELRGRVEGSPLMDPAQYMRDLEAIYDNLWEAYEKKNMR